ncbi:DEAD/DEAH box helicase [Georgenia wangjunii]|uniref:DEAD/DEAH box helicase n=1 Tax=Georgenia wangjunii TaxID=3117730 RepID=UPI002F266E1D
MPQHDSATSVQDNTGDFAGISAATTFADLGLPQHLLEAVLDLGFTIPTDIQAEAIPRLLAGRDVVGIAQTGTGKTAAFGLPLLAAVDASRKGVQALVLTPTRELAMQVSDAIATFAARTPSLRVMSIYGGSSFIPQLRGLREGVQVVVGTPGRVIDLMERGSLDLSGVRFLVLDEADEMLRMGFAEDVEQIAARVPSDRRTALFSATMPGAIKKVAATHLNDPVRVAVSRASSTVSTVRQTYAVVPYKHKVGALARVLSISDADAAIVFVRTKAAADEVAIDLAGRGIQAAAISGDVAQREREKLIERLRAGTLDVLVATDVAARGLDVERIGLVVNFDVPREAESYVHRIGRTGRAGRSGEALTFLTPRERGSLGQIERLTGTKLEEAAIPSPADVSAHRAKTLLGKAPERHTVGRLDLYRELVGAHVAEHGTDPVELAATLLAIAIGDAGPAPRTDADDAAEARPRREESYDDSGSFVQARFEEGRDGGARSGPRSSAARGGRRDVVGTRYRVEVGHRDGVQPGAIVGAITGEGGLRGKDLGKIDIFPSFSLVEISADIDAETTRRIGAARVAGRPLKIRPDSGPRTTGAAPSRDTRRGAEHPSRPSDGRRPHHTSAH